MKSLRPLCFVLSCFLFFQATLCVAPEAIGEEPAAAFLQAMRNRGYYDTALQYLKRAENSTLTPVEFREVIPFERGLTMVQFAGREADFDVRGQMLNEAQASIEQFVKTRGNHPRADNAKNQLGNVVAGRAKMKVEQAEKTGDDKHRELAAELFDQAYSIFARRQSELKDRLVKIGPRVFDPKKQKKEIAQRTQLRADYLQAQLLSAAVLEESAATFKPADAKFKETLQRAADEYTVIYEKHRIRLAGLYAKLYRGRCLAKIQNNKDALADFEELLDNDDGVEALRPLKTNALLLALDVWLKPSQNKYLVATQRGDTWIDTIRPNESRSPEWLTLRFEVAKAHKLKADALKKENPKDPDINRSITKARKLATFVSRMPGDNQRAAREFLVELRGGDAVTQDNTNLPDSFLEAKARGKEALDSLQTAGLILRDVPKRIAAESNAELKKELQTQVDEAKKTLATGKDTAYRMFKHALTLVDGDTELDEINSVRYFICYLSFTRQDYFDAAVMGDFVSRRYPEHAGARQCAKITLASFIQMHRESQDADKEFETQQIIDIAEYMANKWTDQPEGIDALNTLIPFMVGRGDLIAAQKYLKMIPPESPKRAEAELSTGKAMWGRYLIGTAEMRRWEADGVPDGVDATTRKAELEQMKTGAEAVLVAGVGRMSKTPTTPTTVAAVLSLAQVFLDKGDAQKAVELLERPKTGAFELCKAGHPATKGKGFMEETYKTALRAYIAVLPKAADGTATIEKARGVMALLKSEVEQKPGGKKKLVSIYISLARDLERMIALAPVAEKVPLSKGFETFLDEVGKEAVEFNVLNWVAETYYSLGKGLSSSRTAAAESKAYYAKALVVYNKILDDKVATGNTVGQVQVRIAATNRALGKYTDAMKKLTEILKKQNMMLGVQIEAAYTYQEWASKMKDNAAKTKLYRQAMRGGGEVDQKTRKYVVWGWGKIARLTGSNIKFRSQFHESRYNYAKCRFESAKAAARGDQKSMFEKAENDIRLVVKLYPDMGGNTWKPRYDQLAKDIQKSLGKTPVGLKAYEKPAEKTAANN